MGSLDEFYQQLQQRVPEKWRSKLQQNRELAYISNISNISNINKRVATLCTDLTLDGNLQQLRLPIN